MTKKLQSITIDHFDVNHFDIAMALQFLADKSKELDPDHQGINFVLRLPPNTAASPNTEIHRGVSISDKNVSLLETLNHIAQQTNLQYSFDDYAVYFHPGDEGIPQNAPSPAPPANAPSGSALQGKLQSIMISLSVNAATIEGVTNYLSAQSKALDPDKKGVNFIVQPDASSSAKPITLTLNHVPLGEALRYSCLLANVKYMVQDDGVVINSR
jgi:hypothetical protein